MMKVTWGDVFGRKLWSRKVDRWMGQHNELPLSMIGKCGMNWPIMDDEYLQAYERAEKEYSLAYVLRNIRDSGEKGHNLGYTSNEIAEKLRTIGVPVKITGRTKAAGQYYRRAFPPLRGWQALPTALFLIQKIDRIDPKIEENPPMLTFKSGIPGVHKVDETKNEYRFRVRSPNLFPLMRVRHVKPGLYFVVGKKSPSSKMQIQSIRFKKNKYSLAKAKSSARRIIGEIKERKRID